MINILFMIEDSVYRRKLINSLILKNENLRVAYISTELNDFNYVISNYKIDIILVNAKETICKKILNNEILNKKRYMNSVIFINNENIKIDISEEKNICGLVYKKENINETVNSINLLINSKVLLKSKDIGINEEKIIKERIRQELEYIGYNPLHLGTKYLLETIYVLHTLEDYYDDNLEKDIYPIVANKYGKTMNNIKCNIRNATDIMYYENDEEKIRLYLGDYISVKPKAKKIISRILNKIDN